MNLLLGAEEEHRRIIKNIAAYFKNIAAFD
jgi:hypothetical protein